MILYWRVRPALEIVFGIFPGHHSAQTERGHTEPYRAFMCSAENPPGHRKYNPDHQD